MTLRNSGMVAKPKPLSIISGPSQPPLINLTFGQLIRRQSREHANRVAILSQQQNASITYSELHIISDDLAAGMLAVGVQHGDRIAVMLGNRCEYVYLLLACSKIGAVVTLLNYAYSEAEILNVMAATGPKLLFTTLGTSRYNYQNVIREMESRIKSLQRIILFEDISEVYLATSSSSLIENFREFMQRGRSLDVDWGQTESTLSDKDILNLQFTSGSTGAPKAAALTHYGMLNCARYIAINMNISSNDKIIVPVPLFHAFGLIIGLCANLVQGATTVLPSEYFDAAQTLRAVEKYSSTGLYGVTTMFIDQLSHPDFSNINRSSLRFGLMAGSAMPEELLLRVINKFPIRDIYTNWGMTELSSIATMTSASDPIIKKQKTAGRLLPHLTAKIVAPDTDTVLPWGARGEIVVSGFSVMQSYFRNPEKTAASIKRHRNDRRRWMHTGDEGYLDMDGYLVVTGRIKDLIIRGGENISPLEIEERLFEHPAIKQACVFGIPDERYGEAVAAFLEVEDAFTRPNDEEIRAWVRGALSRFKAPVRIWWLGDIGKGCPTEWPKTANGKLRKKDIREIGAELARKGDVSEQPRPRERL